MRRRRRLIAMMKHDTLTATPTRDGSQSFCVPDTPPVDVFYVVRSAELSGDRAHRLCSPLYETRPPADTELVRLRREDRSGAYSVWKSATYVEPAEWLHRVVRLDGTLILRRLCGAEELADAR
jgi:hypothetical protein